MNRLLSVLDHLLCRLGVHMWSNSHPEDWTIAFCTRCGRRFR